MKKKFSNNFCRLLIELGKFICDDDDNRIEASCDEQNICTLYFIQNNKCVNYVSICAEYIMCDLYEFNSMFIKIHKGKQHIIYSLIEPLNSRNSELYAEIERLKNIYLMKEACE